MTKPKAKRAPRRSMCPHGMPKGADCSVCMALDMVTSVTNQAGRMLVVDAKNERVARGLSIRSVAKLTGIAFSTWARLERGLGEPDAETVRRLQAFLAGDPVSSPRERGPTGIPWTVRIEARLAEIERRLDAADAQAARRAKP